MKIQTIILVFVLGWIGCTSKETKKNLPVPKGVAIDGTSPSNPSLLLRQSGYDFYSKGDFARAISRIEGYLLLEPEVEDRWIRYVLYYCYMATGSYENAVKTAERLVVEQPYEYLGYFQVGLAQLWLGRSEEAIKSFQRAIEFESHSPNVYYYLGLAYNRLNKKEDRDRMFITAEREYQQILLANPKDFSANFELASLYLYWNQELQKVPDLIRQTRDSLEESADEDLPEGRNFYAKYYIPVLEGILAFQKGENQKSLEALFAALRNAPAGIRADMAEIYYYIGRNYHALEQLDRAKAFLQKAVAMDSGGIYAKDAREIARGITSKRP